MKNHFPRNIAKMTKSLCATLVVAGSVSACTSLQLGGGRPASVDSQSRKDTDANRACGYTSNAGENGLNVVLCRALEHLEGYRNLADKWERDGNYLQYGTIAAGLTAATAIAYDWHADILRATGLVAGGTIAVGEAVTPKQKATLLRAAVKDLRCIADEIERTRVVGNNVVFEPTNMSNAARIASDAFRKIVDEVNVKFDKLTADVKYGDIITNVGTFANQNLPAEQQRISAAHAAFYHGVMADNVPAPTAYQLVDLSKFSKEIAKCL